MNAAAQWTTIGAMILSGLAMGTVFDVYRVASHRFHVARWLLPGLDVVYWAAATLAVFSLLLDSNHGEVRMYVFLGLGIGVTGYFGLFSRTVAKLSGWLIERLQQLSRLLWRIGNALVFKPVRWIVRLLAKILDITFIVTAALLLWVGKLLYKPLSGLAKLAWKLLLPVRVRLRPPAMRVVRAGRYARDKWREIMAVFRRK
ncbi:spore cortex biosynthesis protein YabQ [Cohnella sp. GCM10027633]|uniref:spore cortex biosynthesis protein YabQ n=1 Tax=unclassified Cohnella TaxID=2636738 RepID=UPI003627549C